MLKGKWSRRLAVCWQKEQGGPFNLEGEDPSNGSKTYPSNGSIYPGNGSNIYPSKGSIYPSKGSIYPSNGSNIYPIKGIILGEDTLLPGGDKNFPPLGMNVLPSSSSQVRPATNVLVAQCRVLQNKPFVTTVIQDWYNLELKTSNEAIYNKLNDCFRAMQSNDLQSAKYWLTQIEQMVISTFSHYSQEKEKVTEITKN